VAHRCSEDSLSNTEAHQRYLWMKRCAPQSTVISDFLENFSGVDSGLGTIDGVETGRTLYPTFMNSSYKPEIVWKAPIVQSGSCTIPKGAYIAAVCVSSCAIPEEQILAQAQASRKMGPVAFVEALTKKYERAATLRSDSGLNSRNLQATKVQLWVTELLDTEQPVLIFKMQSGRSLTITPNHPVLRPDGTMDSAANFKAGDALVKLGGAVDPIVSIDSMLYDGKVYNLFVQSSVPQENIVVTNGYLNGTAFFQNEGAANLNKVLLRKKLTKGIFEQ